MFDLKGFQTPGRNQGQIVEVSYRWDIALQKCIHDQSDRSVRVYQLDDDRSIELHDVSWDPWGDRDLEEVFETEDEDWTLIHTGENQ